MIILIKVIELHISDKICKRCKITRRNSKTSRDNLYNDRADLKKMNAITNVKNFQVDSRATKSWTIGEIGGDIELRRQINLEHSTRSNQVILPRCDMLD